MAGREVREYTNLTDPKGSSLSIFLSIFIENHFVIFSIVKKKKNGFDWTDKKWGKGKEKIDDEDTTFQRMVAKVSALPHFLFLSLYEQFVSLYTLIILDFIIVDTIWSLSSL